MCSDGLDGGTGARLLWCVGFACSASSGGLLIRLARYFEARFRGGIFSCCEAAKCGYR